VVLLQLDDRLVVALVAGLARPDAIAVQGAVRERRAALLHELFLIEGPDLEASLAQRVVVKAGTPPAFALIEPLEASRPR